VKRHSVRHCRISKESIPHSSLYLVLMRYSNASVVGARPACCDPRGKGVTLTRLITMLSPRPAPTRQKTLYVLLLIFYVRDQHSAISHRSKVRTARGLRLYHRVSSLSA